MLAQVTTLQYWKSEHDEQTCEDACDYTTSRGLFVVADGAGTTLFSNLWSRLLVDHFLTIPLLSNDPFEVEWWLRQAQEQYKLLAPSPERLTWNAAQKARSQGSHSTLATLRLLSLDTTSARAILLAIGDSCILIRKANSGTLIPFPLANPTAFDRAPLCLPSKLALFHRYFHRCQLQYADLSAGDIALLATDAVARWILSAANGRYADPTHAFEEIAQQTPATWPAFIAEHRDREEMADDDSTALLIAFHSDDAPTGDPLTATNEHAEAVREQRRLAFEQARRDQHNELLAILYGDGADLSPAGVTLPPAEIQHARDVADALHEALWTLRQTINSPDAPAKIAPVWHIYAPLLYKEPCAANLRTTLSGMGIPIEPPAQEENSWQTELARWRGSSYA